MTWEVHIVHRHDLLQTQVFIWQADGDKIFILRNDQKAVTYESIPRGQEIAPSFVLPMRGGQEILQGFAQQLAQLGFGAPSAESTVKAQATHIASLEKQADRLFDLAKIGAHRQ